MVNVSCFSRFVKKETLCFYFEDKLLKKEWLYECLNYTAVILNNKTVADQACNLSEDVIVIAGLRLSVKVAALYPLHDPNLIQSFPLFPVSLLWHLLAGCVEDSVDCVVIIENLVCPIQWTSQRSLCSGGGDVWPGAPHRTVQHSSLTWFSPDRCRGCVTSPAVWQMAPLLIERIHKCISERDRCLEFDHRDKVKTVFQSPEKCHFFHSCMCLQRKLFLQ